MKKLIASVALVFLLSGCLIPEKFDADIDMATDGSYSFNYSGSVVHGLAISQSNKAGKLTERDEHQLKIEGDKLAKNQGFSRVVYRGNGRYDIDVLLNKKPGEQLKMFDVFSVSTAKDGTITITTTSVKDKDMQAMTKFGLNVNGRLRVKLPKNAEVISHNATSTPYFFGMFGDYEWNITSPQQQPLMVIRLDPI